MGKRFSMCPSCDRAARCGPRRCTKPIDLRRGSRPRARATGWHPSDTRFPSHRELLPGVANRAQSKPATARSRTHNKLAKRQRTRLGAMRTYSCAHRGLSAEMPHHLEQSIQLPRTSTLAAIMLSLPACSPSRHLPVEQITSSRLVSPLPPSTRPPAPAHRSLLRARKWSSPRSRCQWARNARREFSPRMLPPPR
jgi:hypothetical protein